MATEPRPGLGSRGRGLADPGGDVKIKWRACRHADGDKCPKAAEPDASGVAAASATAGAGTKGLRRAQPRQAYRLTPTRAVDRVMTKAYGAVP